MNITAFEASGADNMVYKLSLLLISAPLIFLAVFGNILVLLIWCIHRPFRTPTNIYFISLAIVDLWTGLFVFPLHVAYSYSRQWDFGLLVCRMFLINYFSLTTISAYHLVVIAADRYRVLTEGISYLQKRSMKSAIENVTIIWVIGLWVSGPLILDWKHMAVDSSALKQCLYKDNYFWIAHIWFASFGFPAFLIIRIYWKVFLEIKIRFGVKHDVEASVSKNHTTNDESEESNGITFTEFLVTGTSITSIKVKEIVAAKMRVKLLREKKSAVTLGIIIGAFLICWAPWYFLTLYYIIVPEEYKPPPYSYGLATIFGLANSCFNPIVYAARVPEFQIALNKLFNCFRSIICSSY